MNDENDDLLKTAQTGHLGGRTSLAQSDGVGHSLVFGPTRAGMSLFPVFKELFKDLESGHPGVKASLGPAGSSEAKRVPQRDRAPYYRRFDKRK
ncbi:hypothetical protein [Paraburkholderia sp. SIMBA_054]|uniref:hypothetical protein n=1 Tax=Paraburkholderia sp. SIMBA_054 TaxID=3085795 RepID=UPI00397AD57F